MDSPNLGIHYQLEAGVPLAWYQWGRRQVPDGGLQDTLVDKALFLFLITAGLSVLRRRGADWSSLVRNNKWLVIYFLYLGISVLWSDYPFVSFKRWIKDFGNVVMVLIILSEENPAESVRAFLSRWAYLLIPSSALVIKVLSAAQQEV